MRTFVRVAALLGIVAGVGTGLSSCNHSDPLQEPLCGCTPPPKGPVTAAALTATTTWWLNEVYSAGQVTRTDAITDRFSMQFKPDGTYIQTLLADGTEYRGTWMLMGTDNRTLHLTDHKGSSQELTVEGVNAETLGYGRTGKNGQQEYLLFRNTRL
ncbi:hypothetical protein K3G63_09395 [Hymenobacter sp. HSC-4F20]|uniref:hypothetical protein n=1 Tax=Hymenobacter sp. HSC-4F20 TaxID=2864135 RepID=UPI001C72EC28|nr:hypothetical protein [Hymenobacter sp. HSC-4F20]MBX0290651.1 hypothetical protein [Hymenobacter sp. HSC-4F20]